MRAAGAVGWREASLCGAPPRSGTGRGLGLLACEVRGLARKRGADLEG